MFQLLSKISSCGTLNGEFWKMYQLFYNKHVFTNTLYTMIVAVMLYMCTKLWSSQLTTNIPLRFSKWAHRKVQKRNDPDRKCLMILNFRNNQHVINSDEIYDFSNNVIFSILSEKLELFQVTTNVNDPLSEIEYAVRYLQLF